MAYCFLVNGKPGDIYAVKPGGEGDVTKTQLAWHTPRKVGRDLPSPILVGDHLLAVSMGGVGVCYDAASGKELWKERIAGSYSSAPFAAAGLVYIMSESGETSVLKLGDKLEIVARNKVGGDDEMFRASPVPSNGQLFIRSNNALYCIAKK